MKILNGGFSNIEGFYALGKHVGIKKHGKDFAVLYSEKPCSAVAVYTQNVIKGAPLYVTKEHLKNNVAQTIVVNSGNSNVATGQQGLANAYATSEIIAKELSVKQNDVLVASTGVIGVQLPLEKIKNGARGIKKNLSQKSDFAEAIMTTDTVKKEICVDLGGFKIAGVAKGSGMIEPNMATMLAFLVTDAEIIASQLQTFLKSSVDKSFNMTSIDTDTSTSDMVILMANGRKKNVNLSDFQKALDFVCLELAKMIARDGEGATKLITCEVDGAGTQQDAKKIAKSVVNSPLVKTAIYGNDPNWGRLMMAIGKSGAEDIVENKIAVSINGEEVVNGGKVSEAYDSRKLVNLFRNNEQIDIKIGLKLGVHTATAYGCDMSEDYIKINAEYTT